MVRCTRVIVLFGCMSAPVLLAQAPKQADSAPVQMAASPSASKYPLESFRDFSAVMVGSRAEPGEGRSRGNIYRLGQRLRMEEPGGRGYFITDLDSGESYGVVEDHCIHDDHPYIRAIPFYMTGKADATVTRVSAGKETVDGHSCQIEDVTISSPMLANPQKMRFWEAEDLQGFPIKIEFVLPGSHDPVRHGPIIRYTNVVLGPQDPTLFIHPKSCQALPQGPNTPSTHKKPQAQ